jgi:DNA-binding NarL/FixJ family response regulator
MAGEPIELTLAGQIEAVRQLAARGMSVRRIALLLRTSARTVSRRKAAGAVA